MDERTSGAAVPVTSGPRRLAVDAVGLAPGGGLTYLVNQARLLEEDSRWDVTYFVAPRSRATLAAAVDPGRIRVPFRTAPGYVTRLRWEQLALPRLLREERQQLLYAPGGFAVFGSPVPQLVVDHNAFHHAGWEEIGNVRGWARFRAERMLARLSVRRAEATVYLSEAFADAMADVGFPRPTAVIGSGVAADWPQEADSPLDCVRCSGRGYALAVHNWTPGKRLAWLLRAWAEAPSDVPHLVLVGRPADPPTERDLRAILTSPDVAERVHVFEGVTRGELRCLYRHASLYVAASTLEAFPLTPYEAMSFGVPCVLSDIPAHREVAGDAGVYFEPGRTDSLWRAVDEATSHAATLVARGEARVREQTWKRNVERLCALFERLLEPQGAGGGDRKRLR